MNQKIKKYLKIFSSILLISFVLSIVFAFIEPTVCFQICRFAFIISLIPTCLILICFLFDYIYIKSKEKPKEEKVKNTKTTKLIKSDSYYKANESKKKAKTKKYIYKSERDKLYDEACKLYGKNKVKYSSKDDVIDDYIREGKVLSKKEEEYYKDKY